MLQKVNNILTSANETVKAATRFIDGVNKTIRDLKYIVLFCIILYSAALFGAGYGLAKIIGG